MSSIKALILLLPLLSLLVVMAARSLGRLSAHGVRMFVRANFAWPVGSSFHFSVQKHARKVTPEQCDLELPVARYNKRRGGGDPQAVDCVFCLSGIEDGEEVRVLKCRHLFHRMCLDEWLARPPATCPLCRCRLLTATCVGTGEGEEDDDVDSVEEMDMVVFMAYVQMSSSSWFRSNS